MPNLEKNVILLLCLIALDVQCRTVWRNMNESATDKHLSLKSSKSNDQAKINKSMLKDLQVKIGDEIYFEVEVSGDPPPTITWQVNGYDLEKSSRTLIENDDSHTKLKILDASRSDTGEYSITAANQNGKDTATVSVLVIDCRCREGYCVEEGGKQVCKCNSGYGNITSSSCSACNCGPNGKECMWNGGKVCFCDPGYAQKATKCEACECGPEMICSFEGFWKTKTCTCKPGYKEVDGKCVVPPTINRSMFKDLILKVGESIKFDVNVTGQPPPTITWRVNGKEVKDQNRIVLENTPYNTQLTILSGTRSDSGAYTINAENEDGTDTSTVSVLVRDVPHPPEGEIEVSDVNTRSCKLKWKKPKDDGGAPLLGYKVEMMDLKVRSWVDVARTKQPSIIINVLSPGNVYKFDVRALNEVGYSAPLLTKQPIEAIELPGQPNKPEVTDWDKDHVVLQWTAPESNGGTPIIKYIVQKNITSDNWEEAVTSKDTKATVANLIEGQTYIFRVIAVNKLGPGEASPTTDPVTVESQKETSLPSETPSESTSYSPSDDATESTSSGPEDITLDKDETDFPETSLPSETPSESTSYSPSDDATESTSSGPEDITLDKDETDLPGCYCGPETKSCYLKSSGQKNCTCFPGYSPINGYCAECNCGGNSQSCFYRSDGTKKCRCDFGYLQKNGYCSAICSEDKCLHGKCEITGKRFKCRCFDGFFGKRCENKIEVKTNKQELLLIMLLFVALAIFVLLSGVLCCKSRRKNNTSKG